MPLQSVMQAYPDIIREPYAGIDLRDTSNTTQALDLSCEAAAVSAHHEMNAQCDARCDWQWLIQPAGGKLRRFVAVQHFMVLR